MRLSDYYVNGPNARLVPGILGLFWTRVFPAENGLVSAVSRGGGTTLDYGEAFMRRMIGWLTGNGDDVDFMERLESIPVESVRQEVIRMDDGHLIGHGAYAGAPNGSLRWIIPLSSEYADIPVIIPLGGKPLLRNADYSLDGRKVVLREHPSMMGMTPSLEDKDGAPAACYNLLLCGCVPLNGGGDNFDFYRLPDNARRSMLDLLTQEASMERILRFVQRCVGSLPPTVFEQYDEDGPFTVITNVWHEEGRTYGVTTGGEIVKVPDGFLLAEGMVYDERLRIRPAESITLGVDLFEKASESDVVGIAGGGAFIPNEVKYLAQGETGAIDPAGEWTANLVDVLAAYSKTLAEMFPGATENIIGRIYGRLGRKQPSVLELSADAASRISRFSDALEILRDTLPAGTLLMSYTGKELSDMVSLSVTDTVEPFSAADLSDDVTVNVVDKAYKRGTLI